MKTNFRNSKFTAILFVIAFVLLSGCGFSGGDGSSRSSEIATTFTTENRNKIMNSMIDLPGSLVADEDSSPDNNVSYGFFLRGADPTSDNSGDGMAGIYSGIPHYVSLAEMMKDMVKDVMYHMVDDPLLKNAELGEPIIIPEDPEDPEGPRKVIIEKPEGEDYEWKVSLFFEEDDESADMIVRFTLEGLGARGRILWGFTEQEQKLQDVSIDIDIERKVDVVFDGTGSPQSLEVKVIQDLGAIISYAEASWDALTENQKEALDIGQPGKVFVFAGYDGEEYTIYGTSYHPGWDEEAELKGEDGMFGVTRSMYVFKAKAVEGEMEGAKLYLAIPEETRTSIDGLWEDDSIGNIITDMMLAQINEMIGKQADEADDTGDELSIPQEQYSAVHTMCWVVGDSLCTPLSEHGPTFSLSEHAAFQTFYSGPVSGDYAQLLEITPGELEILADMTSGDLNVWFAGQSDASGAYMFIMLPTFEASCDTRGYSFSKEELEAFIYSDASGDQDKIELQEQYSRIKYMINPAFFNETDGFLGTYDDSEDVYYKFENNTLSETEDDPLIIWLNENLDLISIEPYVPADVVSAEIEIE